MGASRNQSKKVIRCYYSKKEERCPGITETTRPAINQPSYLREKAVEIANEVLKTTHNEGEAIATGLKQARIYFEHHPDEIFKDQKE